MAPEKTAEINSWITEHHFRASLAISAIEAARKSRVSVYDERMRKLARFSEQLEVKFRDQQKELFDPESILSPELKKLLAAPTHGIDD